MIVCNSIMTMLIDHGGWRQAAKDLAELRTLQFKGTQHGRRWDGARQSVNFFDEDNARKINWPFVLPLIYILFCQNHQGG